jgi:hypothetical protein
VVTSSLKVAKRTFVTELFTLSDFFEMAYFQRAKSSAKIISRVFGPKKLSISRPNPFPICPRNVSARIKNITHGAV